ncbi:lipopolysaccharide assembly LapA domain-containing protein [Halalkalibacter sp. APA_J-10(15)]|uniref:LapA family protein n=1 Tax=unclassified Halalkalibacter TaxID=2893063 RepID=UPI001FF1EED2|nr:lipopolysaccharide assembly protein LapA domain-containing protein [Halalkalibacter sp. APA_J-10(15)]MCK0471098.1 lipopolysaccharide assembly protein LapA domain-containing protein [Halalkalibacter sp. APA_J-10(15)]
MRGQWALIISLVIAIIISVFAIINVEAVPVNYLFGVAEWPLILIILGSVLMGAIIAGAIGMVRIYRLQYELKRTKQAQAVAEFDSEANQTIEEEVESTSNDKK